MRWESHWGHSLSRFLRSPLNSIHSQSCGRILDVRLTNLTEVPFQRARHPRASGTFPTDSLIAYTNVSMTTDTLRTSQLFKDLPTVSETRLLAFWPVPPKCQSREEVHLGDGTPYECLHVNSWHSHQNRTFFQPIVDVSTAPVDEPTVMSFTIL